MRASRAYAPLMLVLMSVTSIASAGPGGPMISIVGPSSAEVKPEAAVRLHVTLVNEGVVAADVSVGLVWVHDAEPPAVEVAPVVRSLRLDGLTRQRVAFEILSPPDAAPGEFAGHFVAQWNDKGNTQEASAPFALTLLEPDGPLPPPTERMVPAALLRAAASGALVGGIIGSAMYVFRTRELGWAIGHALAPLYSRINRSEVLQQETRQRIYAAVGAYPGISFSELRRRTGVPNGNLYHHLEKLIATGHIRSETIGRYRVFALAGQPLASRVRLSPAERRVIGQLTPSGASTSELARKLGMTRQAVYQHMVSLESKGCVVKRREGPGWRYILAGGIAFLDGEEALLSLNRI